jgi:hypothetical protein
LRVGLIVGGASLSLRGGFRRRIVNLFFGIIGMGLGLLVVGLTPRQLFPLSLVAMLFGALGFLIPAILHLEDHELALQAKTVAPATDK